MNLWTLCVILFILWLLGFFGHVNLGGHRDLLHILLVAVVLIVIYQLVTGRKPLG